MTQLRTAPLKLQQLNRNFYDDLSVIAPPSAFTVDADSRVILYTSSEQPLIRKVGF